MKKIRKVITTFISIGIAMSCSLVSFAAELPKQIPEDSVMLEIVTDQAVIDQICDENPHVRELLSSDNHARLALVKAFVEGNGVRLRREPSLDADILGLLYESNNDWVVINEDDPVWDSYVWYEVTSSSIGMKGWIASQYLKKP